MGKRKWFTTQKHTTLQTIIILGSSFILGGLIMGIVYAAIITILLNWWKSGYEPTPIKPIEP
jgi:uncharacterized protein YggT (Ycf19 family)